MRYLSLTLTVLLLGGQLASCQSGENTSLPSGYQPNDVLHTMGEFELQYKHILAYIDMEMEGEDLQLLNDQSFAQELTTEAIEEFGEDPESFILDMEAHYEAMQQGLGNLSQSYASGQTNATNNPPPASNQGGGQWKQLLNGSLLYITATQSHNGLTVQSTQFMHLCPNGVAYFYQNSGGGGGDLTAMQSLEFVGSSNWNVIEENGQAYMQMTLQGVSGNLPMRMINQKVFIQGLGALSIQPGGAQCQ